MKKFTWAIIIAVIAIGGWTYYSKEQAKETARMEAVEATRVANEAKAADEAAATKAAEEAAMAAEEAAAMAAEEAAKAAAKAAEEATAMAADEAAKAAAKAAEEAAAMAADEAAKAAAKAAEEAAAMAAEEAAKAAAKAAEEAAAMAAEEAAKTAEEAAAMAAEEAAKAAEEAAAMAAEEAAKAAATAAEEAAAMAAEEAAAAAKVVEEAASTMMMPPFGSEHDVGYAGLIWQAMIDQKLAGPDQIHAIPYEGNEPHGMMLELFISEATIEGHTGDLIVKRNYGPEGVSVEAVQADPAKHLGAVTVMFRREAGFDEDTKNWFWAKFLPDGSLDKNPKGMNLAGKVAKGMDVGCIACHTAADGDDFVFSPGSFE